MVHNLDFAAVVLVVTVAVLLYAAFIDLKHYKISNELILLLIGLFVLHAFLSDRWTNVAWNLGLAAGVFLFLIYFYSRHWIGGGDIKILPVAFLWAGIECAFLFVLLLLLFVSLHTVAARVGWVESQQDDQWQPSTYPVCSCDRCGADRQYSIDSIGMPAFRSVRQARRGLSTLPVKRIVGYSDTDILVL